MLAIGDVQGLWRRSLIHWPDGRRDDTTSVNWLQGPNDYADLRIPAQRPDFSGVTALNDLTREQMLFLASQEGFAGRLSFNGQFFEWQRLIDYQPKSAMADAGRLWFEDGRMIEEGRDVPYIEHWHRDDNDMRLPCGTLRLTDQASHASGFLVRAGSHFMYARDRSSPLPPGGTLLELVSAASLDAMRATIDCEISFGRVSDCGWTIETSSLPFREGANLQPLMPGDLDQLSISDVTATGAAALRQWTISERDGDIAFNAVPLAEQ